MYVYQKKKRREKKIDINHTFGLAFLLYANVIYLHFRIPTIGLMAIMHYWFAPACFSNTSKAKKAGSRQVIILVYMQVREAVFDVLFLYRVGISAMSCKGKGYFNMSDLWAVCLCLSCLSDPWLIPIKTIYAQVGTFPLWKEHRCLFLRVAIQMDIYCSCLQRKNKGWSSVAYKISQMLSILIKNVCMMMLCYNNTKPKTTHTKAQKTWHSVFHVF